ncbi:MAG: ABC transporter substrate-binding protein [Candidatus Rokubacteria bacterium]|nr:ABC transporter substrate-binding protein [Candidatus Rokubacteria bacterium]
MSTLTRRQFLAGTAAASAALAAGAPYVHAQKRGGTMRFIAHADLKVLDPIWTTAYITRNHSYLIYDTLFGTDENDQVKPQMVERHSVSGDAKKWTFTLRDGLKWHDGKPVTAEDCTESIKRWTKRDPFGKLLAAHTAKIAPVDRKTFTLELSERFGPVLEALGKPSSNVPFVMPAHVAATPDSEQIKEFIGSGPFRFVKDEWQPGNQVVYVKNPDYAPRSEPPSGSTGGKIVHLDKVVWRYIPDATTASAALERGEVDWWENPPVDFVPRVEQNPALTTFVFDPRGQQGWLRPNHLHPPFNNKKARQALVHMVDQTKYLQAAVGVPKFFRTCAAVFLCGGPYDSAVGTEGLQKQDLARARQLVKESGYDGRPVVVLQVTDIQALSAVALVTRELLQQAGFNVDIQAVDWSTNLARRAKKEPPAQGGWNVIHTWWTGADVANPAVHAGVSGAGGSAWFGWPENGQIEKLRLDWVRATDKARQKQLADEIQRLVLDEVLYVPWGQWTLPFAFSRKVQGVLRFPAPLFWNVTIA